MTLIKEIKEIIYEMKLSMCVSDINKGIKNINRQCYKADDIWIEGDNHYWNDSHEVYVITTNKGLMKSIYLDYKTKRDLGTIQWTYICNKCGEYLKPLTSDELNQYYECKCHFYLST